MNNVCEDHFLSLNARFGDIIKLSFNSRHEPLLSSLFQFVDDLNLWQSMLDALAKTNHAA